jgi:rubrerythrin
MELIERDLRLSMGNEDKAARVYRQRARSADPKTAKLYHHIAHEEDVHQEEFRARQKQLEKVKVGSKPAHRKEVKNIGGVTKMGKKDLTLGDFVKKVPKGGLRNPGLRVMRTDVKNIKPMSAPKLGSYKNVL